MKYDNSKNYTSFRNQFKDFQRQYAYSVAFSGGWYQAVGLTESIWYPQKIKLDSISIDSANISQGYTNVLRYIPVGFFNPRKISMMFEVSRDDKDPHTLFSDIIKLIGGSYYNTSTFNNSISSSGVSVYENILNMSVHINKYDENGGNPQKIVIDECWPVSVVNATFSSLGEDGYITFQVNFIANK